MAEESASTVRLQAVSSERNRRFNLLRSVRSGSTGPFIACLRDARSRRNPRIRSKSAFSRFAPLHRPDLVGQLRVDLRRSIVGGERLLWVDFVEEVACRGDALLIHFSQQIGSSRDDGRAAGDAGGAVLRLRP